MADLHLRITFIGFSLLLSACGHAGREDFGSYDREYRATSSHRVGEYRPIAAKRAPDLNHTTVRLYYGSDRERTGKLAPNEYYGARRGEMSYGKCDVTIPAAHEPGEIERPWKFLWWEGRENPDKHVVLLGLKEQSAADMFTEMKDASPSDVLLFVHGYNVSFAEATRRLAVMTYDLKFPGLPLLYSWPSTGATLKYIEDGQNAEWAARNFKTLLVDVKENVKGKNIHIIAHSMGSRIVARALSELSAQNGIENGSFKQVILVVPDVDADVFRDLAPKMLQTELRTTMYTSSNDRALKTASAIVGSYPRAGQAGSSLVVVKDLDTIDASAVDTSLIGHISPGNRSVLSDMFYLIKKNLAPGSRFGMTEERTAEGLKYWLYAP